MENPRKVRNGQRTTLMSVILWPYFFSLQTGSCLMVLPTD
nr:MAG TPA_asm: hypothetical protein [Caudoviricetes sp.]